MEGTITTSIAPEVVHLCRDEDCIACTFPVTYYEVDARNASIVQAIGCRNCGWRKAVIA